MQARCEAAAEPRAERTEKVKLRDAIRFDEVSFAYGGGGPLVSTKLHVKIRAEETTAIVGPSGAGKRDGKPTVLSVMSMGSSLWWTRYSVRAPVQWP